MNQTTLPGLKHCDQAETCCCVWLSWKKMNHVYPWGKWGNQINPHSDSILPNRPRPCFVNELRQRSSYSTSVLPSVVALQHPPKFWLASNFGASLGFLLDVCKHSGSLRELVLSLCTLLSWPFNIHLFACWLQFHACSHVLVLHKVPLHVYKLYPLSLTHKVVCTIAKVSLRSFKDLSQALRLSLAPSVIHVESMLS